MNDIKRIYIAGPMTGYEDFNYPVFNAVAASLRSYGFDAVNPAETNLPKNSEWSQYMREAISQLVTCDAVALLSGWQQSKGANIERDLALELGLAVVTFSDISTAFDTITRAKGKKRLSTDRVIALAKAISNWS